MKDFIKIFIALSIIGSAFFIPKIGLSQTYEAGGLIGLGVYKGDMSNLPNPVNFGGNIQAVGKYNFDNYSSIRINIAEGFISGNDGNNSDKLSNNRNSNFKTTIGEFSVIYEHNFFPYRKEKERIITTPYLFGGIGVIGFGTNGGKESPNGGFINPIIPFGIGTKTMLSKNLNLIFEFGTRKTFTDYLDNTHDEVDGVQNGYKNTQDWYSFLSVGITYTFYTVKCPV